MKLEDKFPFVKRKWFKNIRFVADCSIMVALGLVCALSDFSSSTKVANYIAHPIGWLAVLFSGYALFYMLYKYLIYAIKRRGMVEITEKGLTIRDDFVAWNNIVCIAGNKYYIIIQTNNAKDRTKKASWLSKLNNMMDGATLRISNWDYDGSQEEFIQRCLPYIKNKK